MKAYSFPFLCERSWTNGGNLEDDEEEDNILEDFCVEDDLVLCCSQFRFQFESFQYICIVLCFGATFELWESFAAGAAALEEGQAKQQRGPVCVDRLHPRPRV
jgi:hypothetical protein